MSVISERALMSRSDVFSHSFRRHESLVQIISIPLWGLSEHLIKTIWIAHADYLSNPHLTSVDKSLGFFCVINLVFSTLIRTFVPQKKL